MELGGGFRSWRTLNRAAMGDEIDLMICQIRKDSLINDFLGGPYYPLEHVLRVFWHNMALECFDEERSDDVGSLRLKHEVATFGHEDGQPYIHCTENGALCE